MKRVLISLSVMATLVLCLALQCLVPASGLVGEWHKTGTLLMYEVYPSTMIVSFNQVIEFNVSGAFSTTGSVDGSEYLGAGSYDYFEATEMLVLTYSVFEAPPGNPISYGPDTYGCVTDGNTLTLTMAPADYFPAEPIVYFRQ